MQGNREHRTVKLSNSWIIMNPGGPPTPDKPDISVADYQSGDTTSIFLHLRVADIQTCYQEWKARGAEFLTPPTDRGAETAAAAWCGEVDG